MLWFGWFGFNAGSAIGSSGTATAAFVATNTAAAAGMLGWMILDMLLKGKPTAVGAITGAVAGLVAITPACGFVTPLSAIAIGLGVAAICYWALNQRIRWKLDDTLDAFSVHGVGGIFGALMTGILATKAVNPAGNDGLINGNASLVLVQLVAVGATIVFSALVTYLILTFVDATIGIRSDDAHQAEGLDLVEHGEKGYSELV
jgi:Amt family ammonium transporter